MTIPEFIEAAIEGGWKTEGQKVTNSLQKDMIRTLFSPQISRLTSLQDMCLDPEAWKAVGKVKGWGQVSGQDLGGTPAPVLVMGRYDRPSLGGFQWEIWEYYMHQMIQALCQGQTLEAYIATL